MNPKYIEDFKKVGFEVSGFHKNILPEIIELKNHPFFIAIQFYSEFGASPTKQYLIFLGFVQASKKIKKS
jgi:CTP synthase